MRTSFLFLALLGLVFAGCDLIASAVGVDEVEVSTGSAGSLAVVPDQATVSTSSVNLNEDLPDAFDVDQITVPDGSLTYTPSGSAKQSGHGGAFVRAVCDLSVTVAVDGVPAVQGSVQIDEDASNPIQGYSFQYANGYDRDAICAALPEGTSCPVSTDDLTPDQIRDHVTAALQSGRFDLAVVADNPGECEGTLQLGRLVFGLDF